MSNVATVQRPSLGRSFWLLTKPRVVALIMLTAVVGALLALFHYQASFLSVAMTLAGIALVSSSAGAFNCLVEVDKDRLMRRTEQRPLPSGNLTRKQAAIFIALIGTLGLSLTFFFSGWLVCVLSFIAFFGYAVIYTLGLKRLTPQNIVIGGAFGAMPPVLGWVAVSGKITYEPLLLFLIIFVWTPPHFWSLALYRKADYERIGMPMLPVTHGDRFTAVHIVLYSVILLLVTLLPYLSGMVGVVYFLSMILLNGYFLFLALRLWQTLDYGYGKRLFSYSITYMMAVFFALLCDKTFSMLAT